VALASDNPDSGELIGRVLMAAGFELSRALSQSDLVGILEREEVDVVLADMSRSSESDQHRIVSAVREHADPKVTRVPVVMLLGASPSGSQVVVGADQVLARPVAASAIVDAVRTAGSTR
jgi:DNA-binding response OmpR family regulator